MHCRFVFCFFVPWKVISFYVVPLYEDKAYDGRSLQEYSRYILAFIHQVYSVVFSDMVEWFVKNYSEEEYR